MGAVTESGRNPVSTRFSRSVEYEQADAGRDSRTYLARPSSQARTVMAPIPVRFQLSGENYFSLVPVRA